MTEVTITPIFVGLFALIQVPITMAVGLRRARTGIQFLDGGNSPLLRLSRAHGNYTETVPMALLAMAAAEVSSAPPLLLVVGGGSLALGRVLHYATLVRTGWGLGRALGMILTLLPMAVWGAWAAHRIAW